VKKHCIFKIKCYFFCNFILNNHPLQKFKNMISMVLPPTKIPSRFQICSTDGVYLTAVRLNRFYVCTSPMLQYPCANEGNCIYHVYLYGKSISTSNFFGRSFEVSSTKFGRSSSKFIRREGIFSAFRRFSQKRDVLGKN
jgi:hypothetical protein